MKLAIKQSGAYIKFLLIFLTTANLYECHCNTNDNKCSYRISRLNENEYLMVKSILEKLIDNHWNVTLEFLNYYLETQSRSCDQYFDYVAVNQVISKDFRHPNFLFKNLDKSQINSTVKLEYEIEWYEKYKMIKYGLQSTKYLTQCNNIGLKIHFLMLDYDREQSQIFKCSSKLYLEEPVTKLIDYYISQTFLKSCYGNLELLAKSIYKLLKYDCERANKLKIAYFNSKYLNLFRTCNPNLTINDLINMGSFKNCTKTNDLHGFVNKKFCQWFEVVCKFPSTCLSPIKLV